MNRNKNRNKVSMRDLDNLLNGFQYTNHLPFHPEVLIKIKSVFEKMGSQYVRLVDSVN